MILLYSHKLSNRVKYIFNVIFKDVLKMDLEFTSDVDYFEKSTLPKINYSNQKLNTGVYFQASSLLFETGIKEQLISIFKHNELPCFFSVGKESSLPFDVYAASFYLISRYEEYLPQIRDEHDRFTAKESLAFQHNFLEIPLVNIWANEIQDILKKQYPELKWPLLSFKYISTIDIDNAYAYKHKGFLRISAGLIKSFLKKSDFNQRLKVLLNKVEDPYDTFQYQFEIHKKHNIQPIYFFLLGDYALNDKNIPVRNKKFQSLIKSLSDYYEVGIHPSYSSNNDVKKLTKEINRLKDITHKNVTKSRQHFLKLVLPDTYRNIIDNDIQEDYTMGYATMPGFRASLCSPFYFYDLDTESETTLKIYPFAVMEATFQYYLHLSAEDSLKKILDIMQRVKKVNGTFISTWHNESLSEDISIWKGWKNVYESMLIEASKQNGSN